MPARGWVTWYGARVRRLSALGFVAILLGCGWNYTPTDNILPDPNAEDSSSSAMLPPDIGGETGGVEDVPATYRLDCIDIKSLGDADETVFQVATLQNTWAADISNFKLNILIDLLAEDEAAGTGTVTIRSGIGDGWSDQCAESATESMEFPITFEPMVTQWGPSDAEGTCAAPASEGGDGTYNLALGATDIVYIYAQDDDGTAFNCSLEEGQPEAIPISALTTTLTGSADRSTLAGTLTGCMAQADAQNICSCLSVCNGNQHPDCPGCPGGAVPLGLLLGGINPTQNCSDLLGEPAFDITLEYTARRLPAVPMTCG
jgi:hypothetical protein